MSTIFFFIFVLPVLIILCYYLVRKNQNKKPVHYASHNHFYNPGVIINSTTIEETPLSEKEREAYEVLSKAIESPWQPYIRETIDSRSPRKFRELICKLKSYADNRPQLVKTLIGEKAFDVVVNL